MTYQTKNGCYNPESFVQYKKNCFKTESGLPAEKINCVLLNNGTLYAGTDCGLYRLNGDRFECACEELISKEINAIIKLSDSLAVCSKNQLFILTDSNISFTREFEADILDIAAKGEHYWVLTKTHLTKTNKTFTNDTLRRPLEGGEGKCIAVSDSAFYVATENNLSVIHGKRQEWKNILPRFSDLPKTSINSASLDENGYLWLGTDMGAMIHDNCTLWLTPAKINTLPKNAIYKTVTDKKGGRYFASDIGVIYQKNGKLKYFSAARWVPDNKINDIAVADDGSVIYAATDKGLAAISAFETTFADKAAHFEDIIEKYHIRRGFTACSSTPTGELKDAIPDISDNDGLWTGCYVAAEALRYAVTGEQEALEKARRGLKAMLLLTRITDLPGFTARAVRYPGEKGFDDGDHEWVKTADGTCEWKCETSSDEMTGHFFGMSLYYDLCADNSEKEEIKTALTGIMEHILRNNYRLIDHDGLPTTWAAWDPALLNYDDKWFFERGINSLELLAFLKVCHHITDDKKYGDLYNEFVKKHHYPLNVMQHKVRDAHICHIDDNLAFIASFVLLRLEENEALRALYLCGMEDHWEYERIERQPMFCFLHAAFTGRDDDLTEGIQSLREMPFDLSHCFEENSKRKDIIYDTEQAEWCEDPQLKYPLPYDEHNLTRPDAGSFQLDCPGSSRIQEGTIYLLPYWIARYYGLIGE